MSTSTSTGSSRRPRRGGSRRPRSQDSTSNRTPRQPARKVGFFEKLLAFFKGDKGSKPSASKPVITTDRAKPRPQTSARKPELREVTGPRLYVGNLSYDTTESDLFELFNGVGKVQNAEVVANKHTHRSKGFAFVQMQSIDEAKRAVEELHEKDFMGRKLVVSGAREIGAQDESDS